MATRHSKASQQQTSPFVIHQQKQFAALKAAARQELIDVLASMGTVSVPELAVALGRPADALYYHVRILERVGLIEEIGVREIAGRTERLYRTIASDLRLEYKPGPGGNANAVIPIVESMLRITSRDFKAAFKNPETSVSEPQRELWAARTTAWLTGSQVAELNHSIRSMLLSNNKVGCRNGTERLYALTTVLTPLQRAAL